MKVIYAFGIAAMCAVGLVAQSSTEETKTKIDVKRGKEISVNGCLQRAPDAGYVLTNGRGVRYMLVTDDDLSKDVGYRVSVKGKAADRGDGKVEFKSSVGTSGEKTESKTEVKGSDMAGMRYLGVKSVKRLAAACG
jgi:hypothetical protein